ncbi:MAG: META domain-containing protein [Cyclobacteriaceae bacterium]
MKKFLYLSFIVLFITSCGQDDSLTSMQGLEGIWDIETYIDKSTNAREDVLKEDVASIKFEGNEVLVSTFCNGGSGKIEITKTKITVTDLAMTEIACLLMSEHEYRFTDNLSGQYKIEGEKLTIISDQNTDLILTKANH